LTLLLQLLQLTLSTLCKLRLPRRVQQLLLLLQAQALLSGVRHLVASQSG
jgi:hypothetical protein